MMRKRFGSSSGNGGAERTFAWFQKKYHRLVGRWERIAACFGAFLTIATIHIWMQRLLVGYIHWTLANSVNGPN